MKKLNIASGFLLATIVILASFLTIFFTAQQAEAASPYIQNVSFGQDEQGDYIAFDWVGVPPQSSNDWFDCRRDIVAVWLNRSNPSGANTGDVFSSDNIYNAYGDFFGRWSSYSRFGNHAFASGRPTSDCITFPSPDPVLSENLPRNFKVYVDPLLPPERFSFTGDDFITIQLLGWKYNAQLVGVLSGDTEKYHYQVSENPLPTIPYTNLKFGFNKNDRLNVSFDWIGLSKHIAPLIGFNGRVHDSAFTERRFTPDTTKDVSMTWEKGGNLNFGYVGEIDSVFVEKGKHYEFPVAWLEKWTPNQAFQVNFDCGSWWWLCANPISKDTLESFLGRSLQSDDYITITSYFNDPNKYYFAATTTPNNPPTLSYSQDLGYVDDGINPDDGNSNTNFTFKIVYTDADNDPPTDIRTIVFDGSPADSPAVEISSDVMTLDSSADAILHDGNYTNGEQYALAKSFPVGIYRYRFQASDGEGPSPILDGIAGGKEQRFEVIGYSNIIFLPGILGSRLYEQGTFFENQLWEPNRHEDVRQLYMESDGTSSNLGIYAKEGQVIDQIQEIGGNIYESFIGDLEKWKTEEKIIKDYAVIPYDWRLDFDALLSQGRSDGEKIYYSQTTNIPYITETIKNLAATSDTGKVVIVAHSMGGLVAKKVIDELSAQGLDIVEQLILVASPQLGTPKAILGLLHGEEVTGLSRLVISQEEQRTLAENMPTAYTLLPSEKYFERVLDPVVKFSTSTTDSLLAPFVSSYGASINSMTELNNFLLGKEEGRTKPSPEDTLTPNILNEYLVQKKIVTQAELDEWQGPLSIQISQIAGWGLDTIRTLNYREEEIKGCGEWPLALKCWTKKVFWHEPDFTIDGDETVVEPSATAISDVDKFYINLPDYNCEIVFCLRVNRKHGDIFEVDSVRELIRRLVKNEVDTNNLPPHTTTTKPIASDEDKRLRLRALSPVSVNVYDSFGNHTGLTPHPDPESDLMVLEEEIPNSYYLEIGEGKYLGVGSQDTYRIEFMGQDLGSVTLAIDEVTGDNVIGSRVFNNIPIIKGTRGTLTTRTLQNMSNLSLDIENDGVIDFSIAPQSAVSPLMSVEILRRIVITLELPKGTEQSVVSKIDAAVDALNRGNTKTALNQINALTNYIEAQAGKQIPLEESGKLLNTIEKMRKALLSL